MGCRADPLQHTLLLDSAVLLKWWVDPGQLSSRAKELLQDPSQRLLVSTASLWEISEAIRNGGLQHLQPVVWQLPQLLAADGFEVLPLQASHALEAGQLPAPLNPVSRLLIAQVRLEGIRLISSDWCLRDAVKRSGVLPAEALIW